MSPVELSHAPAPATGVPAWMDGGERLLCGWGRTAPARARILRPRGGEQVAQALAVAAAAGGTIARGAGRSYGDAAQNGGGTVIDATALAGAIKLLDNRVEAPGGPAGEELPRADAADSGRRAPATRVSRLRACVGAGVSFAPLLTWLAARGLTLPVVPGTRHLTVGGAIAADVHGKSHPCDGSFARHVESIVLCTPADGPRTVSRDCDPELFHATLGGMGLTGVVIAATLRLAPLRNPRALADIDRLDTLEQALALMSGTQHHRYAIAWLDLLAPGRAFGRGVLTRSEEAPAREDGGGGVGVASHRSTARVAADTRVRPGAQWTACARPPVLARAAAHMRASDRGHQPFALRPMLTVPPGFPGGVLRPAAVRAFNALHWHAAPRRARGRTLSMSAQLFPLDALGQWSRLYGPAGMVQYQFALPRGREEALLRVVHLLRVRRAPMYLAALKRFGPAGAGTLSFPLEGLTLAIDLPAGAPGLARALDDADELVAGAGGRVYLAKDSRLRPATLAAMYPQLERFRELRGRVDPDGVLRSDLGRRLGLCT
ncbi:MAG TPA: FAD-binding protein [Solirubrobacteraceae bacterium]|jgi:decaprenylphospho-beta-D-ribofuranose 2-oxidase|nr:FAD-binding protein [Solirubrobacteraceae bacterium]